MVKRSHSLSLSVAEDQPLIGVFALENGRELVRYFADETEADQALVHQPRHDPRRLAGAWSDLDWDAMADELDRIRHANPPTPPISL